MNAESYRQLSRLAFKDKCSLVLREWLAIALGVWIGYSWSIQQVEYARYQIESLIRQIGPERPKPSL